MPGHYYQHMIINKTSENKTITNDVVNFLETENIHDIVISHLSKITLIYSSFEWSKLEMFAALIYMSSLNSNLNIKSIKSSPKNLYWKNTGIKRYELLAKAGITQDAFSM